MNAKHVPIQALYSDLYKEVYGFRPFYEEGFFDWTEEKFRKEYSELLKYLETPSTPIQLQLF